MTHGAVFADSAAESAAARAMTHGAVFADSAAVVTKYTMLHGDLNAECAQSLKTARCTTCI